MNPAAAIGREHFGPVREDDIGADAAPSPEGGEHAALGQLVPHDLAAAARDTTARDRQHAAVRDALLQPVRGIAEFRGNARC